MEMSAMKKLLSAGAAVCLIVIVVLIAGSTTTATNNTTMTTTQGTQPATATAGATNVSQYLTAGMHDRGFKIVTPFSRLPAPQNGTARYNGMGRGAKCICNETYEVFNTAQDAQARYKDVVNGYVARGYKMIHQNSTAWSGRLAYSKGVEVLSDTSPLMPNHVIRRDLAFTGVWWSFHTSANWPNPT